MSALLRVDILCVGFFAGILSVAAGATAQTASPVVYRGLTHSAIGGAVLQVDARHDTLEVTHLDPNGADGVAVHLRDTTTDWNAALGTLNGGLPFAAAFNAVAEGESISSASLRQAGDRISLSARFTGATTPTYAAVVFKEGKLVASLGGVPPTAQTYIPIWVPCEFLENGCSFFPRFRNNPNGACEWSFVFHRAGRITLPDGRHVTGDEVRLIEEVRPAGHYPYLSFDGVTIQTTGRTLTLFSESAR
jgi:hypothetical protein